MSRKATKIYFFFMPWWLCGEKIFCLRVDLHWAEIPDKISLLDE